MALVLGGLMAAWPAFAQDLAEDIARQMRQQGFLDVGIERTWLGRTRITGTRDGGSREIIANPNTGEILRDLWLDARGQVRAADIDLGAVGAADGFGIDGAAGLADDARDDRQDARDDRQDARDDARDDRDDSGDDSGDDSDSGGDDSGGDRGRDRAND